MTAPTSLTIRQCTCITHLIAHPRDSQVRVAEVIGVTDRTLRSWYRQPHFVAALDAATEQSEASARGLARRLHAAVILELSELALDNPSPAIRLKGCIALLDYLHENDVAEIVERLDLLEQQQTARG